MPKAMGSYPTYEEWKLALCTMNLAYFDFGSYPTYEEWKPFHSLRSVYPTIRFLSYL